MSRGSVLERHRPGNNVSRGRAHGAGRRRGAQATLGSRGAMTIRTRKLVGTVALLMLLSVYAFLAMLVAIVIQVNGSKLGELVFFVIAGLAWVVPAAWLVRWMQKPDAPAAE